MECPSGIEIRGETGTAFAEILTPPALAFVAELVRQFAARRHELLAERVTRQQAINAGTFPDFLPETMAIRRGDWNVAPVPTDLLDRRVEITGPVERKMVINALNSGARVFMADFEDAHAPTWAGTMHGQINLRDAVRGTIVYESPEGKRYALNEKVATLMVRPRGWHLPEKHVLVDGQPISGSLFDFGLFFFHNAQALIAKGTGPYFYLPKLESHREARLWNDVFVFAQKSLAIPLGTIKATVLIETILAVFEMDEILYELRDHSAGLNCGRWDYIFSFIKKFHHHRRFLLPDRALVTMEKHFLQSYVDLLIQTCHRRGAHAMGGMAAQIPIKHDPAANEVALEKVRADKLREVTAGHDGTWVAHPGLVPIAMDIFAMHMPKLNQLGKLRREVKVTAADLLTVPTGEITEQGVRVNLNVGVQYLAAWLGGNGCVPLAHLMEDAATAEISRAQLWQWVQHEAALASGEVITRAYVSRLLREELATIQASVGEERFARGNYRVAAELFETMTNQKTFPDFLTLVAYDHLN